MQTTVSAPFKLILLGEHAVVYGKPALLATVDKRLYVTIQTKESGKYQVVSHMVDKKHIPQFQYKHVRVYTSENIQFIKKVMELCKKSFRVKTFPSMDITISSSVPPGVGFGSSAAFSAAFIGALMRTVLHLWNPQRINEICFEAEKIAHGNPSGADNTTVVFGGLVWFRREFDFLRSIWQLPIQQYKIPQFIAVLSGRPKETTKEMVALVEKRYKTNKTMMEKVFADQERETKALLLSFKSGNISSMKKAIAKGESNLESMGVVGKIAKQFISSLESKGGVGKICGAGGVKEGSGVILCYHHNVSVVNMLAKKYLFPSYPVQLGSEGIRVEKDASCKQ